MKNKIKVLVVDDSLTSRSMIAKYLDNDYECLLASDGEEGWQALLDDDSIMLVFADMHMPVLNGMLLLKRMRDSDIERIASTPVIIITGHEDSEAAKRASYSIGATDFISKPFIKSEILCCAGSFTRQDRIITASETDIAQDVLSGLHDNPVLSRYGSKWIAFSERHDSHASVMYIQIAGIEKLIADQGEMRIKKVAASICQLLEESLREEEIVSAITTGKYAVVLPGTKAFKANIVAGRLQRAVKKRSFQFADGDINLGLAIGITSTESGETEVKYLTFGEYCIQAQHALSMSLESRDNHIVRFDETYEKKVQSEAVALRKRSRSDIARSIIDQINMLDKDNFNDVFSDILNGHYDRIPSSCLDMMIEPMENFLEFAKVSRDKHSMKAG